MSIIAQITLINSLVYSIMMNINEYGSNFILNALSLLLYLAFQCFNRTLSNLHESIIK